MSKDVRLRFAPSPTGPLHIGGVRTALYNYLFAKKMNGTFILRIEDTDTTRYVPGAEAYINEALQWLGISSDEGVEQGGTYGPYRQSDRKAMYLQFAEQLVQSGHAYYAFDSAEQLDAVRTTNEHFKYGPATRLQMNNSLTLSTEEVQAKIASGDYVIRIKLNADEEVIFDDLIRGQVRYNTNDMDDKVLYKGRDAMPTYHLANVVDDYHMNISHVVRGEEWLPSTPLHVLLYTYLGWLDQMPAFAHLPLIMKPKGNGKLSKRDAAKFDMPVFPLNFINPNTEEAIKGFREWGFQADAVLNFLALLGWNPGNDQEIFSLEDLVEAFDLERVSKSGARFDFDKAKWFNQQYIMKMEEDELAKAMLPYVKAANFEESCDLDYLKKVAPLMKERLMYIKDIVTDGHYFFEMPNFEEMKANEGKNFKKKVLKKWDEARKELFLNLIDQIQNTNPQASAYEKVVKEFMETHQLGFGDVLPFLRLAISGTMKGPGVFEMIETIGAEYVADRMKQFCAFCDNALAEMNA